MPRKGKEESAPDHLKSLANFITAQNVYSTIVGRATSAINKS